MAIYNEEEPLTRKEHDESSSPNSSYYDSVHTQSPDPPKQVVSFQDKISAFLKDANTRAATPFALRMGILLTLSSLFVLISTPKFQDRDGMSVLVTVLFVCWFPTLDSGSILEKIVQRLIGTFVGATLGVLCGFTSLLLVRGDDNTWQIVYLAACMLVCTFMTIFLAGRVQVGKRKVIQRFAYATILCVLTFCICMLPFASPHVNPKWKKAMDRVVNVILGCILGAIGSFLICPRPTVAVLYEKTARQVKLAGEASQAVSALCCLQGSLVCPWCSLGETGW